MNLFRGVVLGLLLLGCPKEQPVTAPEGPKPIALRAPVTPPAAPRPPPPVHADDAVNELPPMSPATLFDVERSSIPSALRLLKGMGVHDERELRAVLLTTQVPARSKVAVLAALEDHVGVVAMAQALHHKAPGDGWLAWHLARSLRVLGRDAEALDVAQRAWAHRDEPADDWSTWHLNAEVAHLRCELLWDLAKDDQVSAACLESYQRSHHTAAHRTAARWFAKHEQGDEALSVIEKALERRDLPLTYFARGVIRAEQKNAPAARASFEWASQLGPRLTPAWQCLEGAPCDIAQADLLLAKWNARLDGMALVNASRWYRLLGTAKEVELRLEAAERRDPGAGLAERLLWRAAADEAGALVEATRHRPKHPHIAVLASVLSFATKPAEARAWLDEAVRADPGNPFVNRALGMVCARQGDAECFARTKDRCSSGDPRREIGSNNAVQFPSSLRAFSPPRITSFVVAPRVEGALPEVNGLAEVLQRRFPGIPVTVLAPAPLPREWLVEGRAVDLELAASESLGGGKALVTIVDRDGLIKGAWRYGLHDETRGAVSVSRFRSAKGAPTEPSSEPVEDARAAERLQNQVTSTMAKMLGLSAPCPSEKCVLKFPRHMGEFDAKGGEFCEAHRAELRASRAQRGD